jgi:predicted SnoaL-like aldol condensation-catalyzing enzyme
MGSDGGSVPGHRGATCPNATGPAHDAAANKQLVLEFNRRVFDAHDPDAVTEFLAEDYEQHAGHVMPGRDGVANFVREVFPDGPIPAPDEVPCHRRSSTPKPTSW